MKCKDCRKDHRCVKHNFMTQVHDAAVYWHAEKNEGINPHQIAPRSAIKAWFRCPSWKNCGHHTWQTTLSLFSAGTRCPFCIRRKFCPCTAAWTAVPNIQLYWDFSRNKVLPTEISSIDRKIYFFRCVFDHEWSESIRCFSNHPRCPKC